MKKLSILTAVFFLTVLVFTACSEDSTTELGWTNQSDAAINDIVWADDDAEWTKGEEGYEDQENTEMKEITQLEGTVDCTISDGQEFVTPDTITVGDNAQASLDSDDIKEGSSNRFDITATYAKKK